MREKVDFAEAEKLLGHQLIFPTYVGALSMRTHARVIEESASVTVELEYRPDNSVGPEALLLNDVYVLFIRGNEEPIGSGEIVDLAGTTITVAMQPATHSVAGIWMRGDLTVLVSAGAAAGTDQTALREEVLKILESMIDQ